MFDIPLLVSHSNSYTLPDFSNFYLKFTLPDSTTKGTLLTLVFTEAIYSPRTPIKKGCTDPKKENTNQ